MTPSHARLARRIIGFGALFSGVALLGAILASISLALALAFTATLFIVTLVALWGLSTGEPRARLGRTIAAGIITGIIATLVYDATKFVLSQLDPSPYNPFELMRVFGFLLLGDGPSAEAQRLVGTSFHLLNGTMFGLSYVLLFGRDGRTSTRWAIATGIGWGLFLETFQIVLYPGWAQTPGARIYFTEFATISALSHVFFGLTLGLLGRWLLTRWLADETVDADLEGGKTG